MGRGYFHIFAATRAEPHLEILENPLFPPHHSQNPLDVLSGVVAVFFGFGRVRGFSKISRQTDTIGLVCSENNGSLCSLAKMKGVIRKNHEYSNTNGSSAGGGASEDGRRRVAKEMDGVLWTRGAGFLQG
jgi:hypothetical protein